jgi:hypothetical protein
MTYRYRRLGLPRDALESGSGIQVDTRRSTIQDPRGGPQQRERSFGSIGLSSVTEKAAPGCSMAVFPRRSPPNHPRACRWSSQIQGRQGSPPAFFCCQTASSQSNLSWLPSASNVKACIPLPSLVAVACVRKYSLRSTSSPPVASQSLLPGRAAVRCYPQGADVKRVKYIS